ncbi:unnamed protein product [Protopolystoma xenopodis]|uniref:Uncharacterized protein n=1 Tax=Protopolystoma xenopodis TaxID=117903 RepID=A0A3S5CFS6_9PLAT|nr:unnamed protein product [Protopolystoma xenopodis]
MSLSFDDVRYVVRLRPKRWRMSCGQHQPERRIKAKQRQFNANLPAYSGKIDLRISSSSTSMRNESLHINRILSTGGATAA